MIENIRAFGREPRQRNTLYGDVSEERREASLAAAPLQTPVNTPARKYEREAGKPELLRNQVIGRSA